MQDKVILENVLTLTKSLAMLYINGSIESANKNITNCLNKGLETTLSLQQELYQMMSSDGFYTINNVSDTAIDKVYKKLTNQN